MPKNIRKIGIINNSCIHVPISIVLAKKKIVYIDINLKDFSVDINDLKKKNIDALIVIHSFGYKCDIEKIKNYTKKKNIFLIEDLAVAQGLTCNNNIPAGHLGEISILSFVSGKIINAGGGGALLTNNFDVYKKVLNLNKTLDDFQKQKKIHTDLISKLHTKVYNQIYIYKREKNLLKKFKIYMQKNAKSFIYKFENFRAKKILEKTIIIKNYINLRRKNYLKIYQRLSKNKNKKYSFLPIRSKFIPWRFNIFFKNNEDRNFAMRSLLKKKINVSSWYSGLDIFFNTDQKLKNSDHVSKSILNIWINEESDKDYRNKVVNFLINM